MREPAPAPANDLARARDRARVAEQMKGYLANKDAEPSWPPPPPGGLSKGQWYHLLSFRLEREAQERAAAREAA